MRSCLLFIRSFCSILLKILNVCFLNFANGKTLEKGNDGEERRGRWGQKIKMWQSINLRPVHQSVCLGLLLKEHASKTDFESPQRRTVVSKSADLC